MTTPPPAPPSTEAPSKKLSPWAWVAIGCGCLLLLVGGCFVAGTVFFAKVGSEMAEDFAENPELRAAEWIARVNPDLELVESDEQAGTVTVRNREGEEITVSLEELREGRIVFESTNPDGETQSVEINATEDGLTVQDSEGNTTLEIGEQSADDLPGWVPLYPGTEPRGAFAANRGDSANGSFRLETDDEVEQVIDFYRQQMESLGLETSVTETSRGSETGGMVSGRDGGRVLTVVVSRKGSSSNIVVSYAENG